MVGSIPALGSIFPILITPDDKHMELPSKYIGRALFQNALSANPKTYVAMPMLRSEIMFWKSTLHKYVHMYAYYTYVKNSLLKVNRIFELGIGIATSFSGMALNAFWKRALHILC